MPVLKPPPVPPPPPISRSRSPTREKQNFGKSNFHRDSHHDDRRSYSHRGLGSRDDERSGGHYVGNRNRDWATKTKCPICYKWVVDLDKHQQYSTRCLVRQGGNEDLKTRCTLCHKMVATSGLEQRQMSCKGGNARKWHDWDAPRGHHRDPGHCRDSAWKAPSRSRSPSPAASQASVALMPASRGGERTALQTAAVNAMASFLRDMAGMMDEQNHG